jgi:histidinol dehydrogenase
MRILFGTAAANRVRKIASRQSSLVSVEPVVRRIIADVRRNGDRALRKYGQQWDGLGSRESLRVSPREIQAAWKTARPELKSALQLAAANIRRFCEFQKPIARSYNRNGIELGQRILPLEAVGCYVPGGRYPLVSTLLMTAIPAQVAGVDRVCVVSPRPQADMLAAAAMLGIREVYRVGGAQAIAALSYGTKSIPRVDKLVGPGNLYVTAAKKLVAFDCSIDFLAGPTEVAVVSDIGYAPCIAADLVAQAEHDTEALAVFITTRRRLAEEVAQSVVEFSRDNQIASEALRRNGVILLSQSRTQSFAWANAIAPEHITVDPSDVDRVRNAGSIFVGDHSAQAAGDYASGPNHVLPTAGVARFRGGLSVLDFVKVISVQRLAPNGLWAIAPAVIALAETEGLRAHAESTAMRCFRA